jgi:hypothetical protein
MAMDNDRSGYRLVLSLTSVDYTWTKAQEVMDLADKHTQQSATLCGCTLLLVAAALDQGLTWLLKMLVNTEAAASAVLPQQVPSYEAIDASLRTRFVKAPEIASRGKYRLRPDNRHVSNVHQLVTIRNDLIHVKDSILLLAGDDPRITFEADGRLGMSVKLPRNYWKDLSLDQTREMFNSTRLYSDQVLFPRSKNLPDNALIEKTGDSVADAYLECYQRSLDWAP